MVSVFIDIEKAYNTTWKYRIMKDLHDMDLRARYYKGGLAVV